MAGYRTYHPPQPLLVGYDPVRDLPADHLARLVEQVVEEAVDPTPRLRTEGQPPYDPRLCLKVLLFGYATGVRSSRRLEQLCREALPFLFLTRGDTPSYRTLCNARKALAPELEVVWEALLAVAGAAKLRQVGRLVLDSSRWPADAGREATVGEDELAAMLAEFRRILAEAEAADAAEDAHGPRSETRLGTDVAPEQVREIVRRVRRQQAARTAAGAVADASTEPLTGDPPPGAAAPAAAALPAGAAAALTLDLDLPPPTDPDLPTTPKPPREDPPTDPARPAAAGTAATPTPPGAPLTLALRRRLEGLVEVLEAAAAAGRKHVNLTDPDAQFMPMGAGKKLGLGHSFEAATDGALLLVGQRGSGANDNCRLEPILTAAEARLPAGFQQVDADSGFYQGETIGKLLREGVDVCIPDSNTAGDLHRRQPVGTTRKRTGEWKFLIWDAEAGYFRCDGDNELRVKQVRAEHGQTWTVYRAVRPCTDCPYAADCLQREGAKYRTVRLGEYHAELEAARQRFNDPEHQARYRQRGPAIETVFAFIEHVLGYRRWWLRGAEGTTAEAKWIGMAYLLRKVASHQRSQARAAS